ncbi:energy transducer TonB [Hymenobacter sp. NST-14]|uniref:energy transducer TonB n=1 Tax=Hymenobacter piscis TaxID=2839984 RepID=UPI001C038244|nr:energy transducer TonB [Hymenobacter piscis]MBT9393828.1 energy transducer TonB [Hymenobacter piscis]
MAVLLINYLVMMPKLPLLLLLLTLPAGVLAQSGPVALTDSGHSATAASPEPAPPAAAEVYHTAEQPPAFPGGPAAFQKFMSKELHYPDEALRRGLSGRVYVRFLVTEAGHIQDAEVVKGLGGGLDEEALRLVRIMPWWTPARIGGQPVRFSYTLPIIFRALD